MLFRLLLLPGGRGNVEHDGLVAGHVVDVAGGGVHEDGLPVRPHAITWEGKERSVHYTLVLRQGRQFQRNSWKKQFYQVVKVCPCSPTIKTPPALDLEIRSRVEDIAKVFRRVVQCLQLAFMDVSVDVVLGPDPPLHRVEQVHAPGPDARATEVAVPDGRGVGQQDVHASWNLTGQISVEGEIFRNGLYNLLVRTTFPPGDAPASTWRGRVARGVG